MTTSPPRPRPRFPVRRLGRTLAIFGASLVLGGLTLAGSFYGYRAGFGSAVGGKCEDVLGCKPGAVCISRHCYASCASDADCPSGSHCAKTRVEVSRRGAYSPDETRTASEERICFAPRP